MGLGYLPSQVNSLPVGLAVNLEPMNIEHPDIADILSRRAAGAVDLNGEDEQTSTHTHRDKWLVLSRMVVDGRKPVLYKHARNAAATGLEGRLYGG